MRIDAHGHACGEYVTLETINKKLDENKIDKVVLFPGEVGNEKISNIRDSKNKEVLYFSNIVGEIYGRFVDIPKKINFGNSYVHYLKLLAPDKIIQFYWLTPKYLPLLNDDYSKIQFSGIKLHQCIKYFGIKSKFFNAVLDFAEKYNLPIIIHLYGKKDAQNIIDVIKGRNVKIIISHLLFYKIFAEHWVEIKNNIYFDIASYYFINRDTIINAIELFGCEKLIFGSDSIFGDNCIEKTIALVNELPISEEDKKRILGENIQNILGLS